MLGGGINDTLPGQVANFRAVQNGENITVSWDNPSSYFSGVLITKKTGSAPSGVKDGTAIYNGTGTSVQDTVTGNATPYYYRAFPYNYKIQYQTEYNVASVTPQGLLRLLSPGDLLTLNENGTPALFYVATHDYENDLNGGGRTLVVRKDIYNELAWNSIDVNAWESCSLRSWLNSTYKALLDINIQNLMGATTYRYTPGNGNYTVTTISDAVFMLSVTEFGKLYAYANVEGYALPISDILRTDDQWTRSPNKKDTTDAISLFGSGTPTRRECIYTDGTRPAFTLPDSLRLNETPNPDGSYSPLID